MTTSAKIKGPGQQLRSLVRSEVPDHLKEPQKEWAYHRPLRPSVVLVELWQARHIVRTITERNLRVRYKQSILGFAWALLTPLGLLAVLSFVFGRVAGVNSGDIPYPLFAYIALLPWTFFAASATTGGSSIVGDKALLNKSQFPREVFPLASVGVAMVDGLMAMIPLVVLFAIEGRLPAATTPLAIIPILVLVMFAAGMSLILSAAIVYVRDIRVALPLILQIGLFATPVAYGLDLIPHGVRMLYCFANPVAPVIDSLRRTVIIGGTPQWGYLGAGALTAFVMLIGGYVLFKKLEGGLADVA